MNSCAKGSLSPRTYESLQVLVVVLAISLGLICGSFPARPLAAQPVSENTPLDAALALAETAEELARLGLWSDATALMLDLERQFPDWPRPKVQLVSLYLIQGQDRAAARRIQALLDDPQLPLEITSALLARQAEIQARQRLKPVFSAYVAPGNNINDGASTDSISLGNTELRLSEASRARPGVAAGAGAGFEATFGAQSSVGLDLSTVLALEGLWLLEGTLWGATLKPASRMSVRVDLGQSVSLTGWGRGRVEVDVQEPMQAPGLEAGLGVSLDWAVSPSWRLNGSLAQDWVVAGLSQPRVTVEQSTDRLILGFSLQPNHSRWSLSGKVYGLLVNAPADHLSYDGWGGALSLERRARTGVKVSGALGAQRDDGFGVYPGQGSPRWSNIIWARTVIGHSRLNLLGLKPHLIYDGRWEKSNIAFNQRSSHSLSLGLRF